MREAPLADGALQVFIFRRIDDVDAAREHGDRPMLERCHVRCRIDAAGEPRSDDEALKREIGRELARKFLSDGGAVACADDGDDGNVGEIEPALGVEEGRGRVDLSEGRRIARLPDGDEACAQAFGSFEFGLGSASVQRRISWARPPRRDSIGSASMAASAPPNSLTRVRKVSVPTFSLLISLSQLKR